MHSSVAMKRTWLKVMLFVMGSVVAQVVLLWISVETRIRWLSWPLKVGIYSMRLLPGSPFSAGSFLVFPTVAQILLALAINTAVYGLLFLLFRSVATIYLLISLLIYSGGIYEGIF